MTQSVPKQRKPLTVCRGVVDSRSGKQTVKVIMQYLVKHPKYGKILRRRTVAHVHDQHDLAAVGDQVEIVKCRPLSKTKCWRLLRVLEKASTTTDLIPDPLSLDNPISEVNRP